MSERNANQAISDSENAKSSDRLPAGSTKGIATIPGSRIVQIARSKRKQVGIERAWVHARMRAGADAIQRCRNDRPPRCQCWSAVRETLWQASASEKTPEALAAMRIYDLLKELELGSRPERAGRD